jgi:acetyltransferase-like isoleucine patch superfamily enzyme
MKLLGRAIKGKLKLLIQDELNKQVNPINNLIQNGNLVAGENCLFDGFFVHTQKLEKDFVNVTIGKNCYLMGQIELYSPTARVVIGDGVFIGPNTKLFCRESITIENDVMVSWGCTIIDTNAHSLRSEERKNDVVNWKKGPNFKDWTVVVSKPVIIRQKSWIGFNAIISKGVIVDEGTVVGSGSVVTKSTEKFSVVAGNPSRTVKFVD